MISASRALFQGSFLFHRVSPNVQLECFTARLLIVVSRVTQLASRVVDHLVMTATLVKLAGRLMAQIVKHLVQVVSLIAVRAVRAAILCAWYAMVRLKKTALAVVKSNFSTNKQSSVLTSALMVILVIWKQHTASLVLLGVRNVRTMRNVCRVDRSYCLLATLVKRNVQQVITAAKPTPVNLVMVCVRNALCPPVIVSIVESMRC